MQSDNIILARSINDDNNKSKEIAMNLGNVNNIFEEIENMKKEKDIIRLKKLKGVTSRSGCACCCASHGGGKAKFEEKSLVK